MPEIRPRFYVHEGNGQTMTATGDNPNCGKPVKRGGLPAIDASRLPSIPQEILADRSEWREQAAAWREQAAAWSELFQWCCRNGFEPADNRYSGLTGLGTISQWILDLKAAANQPGGMPPISTEVAQEMSGVLQSLGPWMSAGFGMVAPELQAMFDKALSLLERLRSQATLTAAAGADAPVAETQLGDGYHVWDTQTAGVDNPPAQMEAAYLSKEVLEATGLPGTPSVAPQEDPEEWVTQDRVPFRRGVDRGWWAIPGTSIVPADTARWWDWQTEVEGIKHGEKNPLGGDNVLNIRCRRKDLPPVPQQTTVTHGGQYVAREVYDRLRQAAEVVVKAAKINNRDFIQHLSGVDSTIVKLRAALVALGDVLREIG